MILNGNMNYNNIITFNKKLKLNELNKNCEYLYNK